MQQKRKITFSPPDVGPAELELIGEVLESGWITTGPKTKEFEQRLTAYTGADGTAALSSATAALECALRLLGIGPGDEVITSAYTYTASASCACHVGAIPVLVDTAPDSLEMDYDAVARAITPRTKAVIPVDIAGRMCDLDTLKVAIDSRADMWTPENDIQRAFSRVPIVVDCAHSLGAERDGVRAGHAGDFSAFSFHAIKNLTTAEGGALAWNKVPGIDSQDIYQRLMLMSLHGQNKDALAKDRAGSWEYDIVFPGWKCNMTDIQAAMGLAQLDRYDAILARRREIVELYKRLLADMDIEIIPHFTAEGSSSAHLLITRLTGKDMEFRNELINRLGEEGVASNVHYKPLPTMTAYKDLGYSIDDYPNAYAFFANELSLPLHTKLTDDDVTYICDVLHEQYARLEGELR